MEKKLRETAKAIIDYIIKENLPIPLDNICVYKETRGPILSWHTHRVYEVYYNIDRDIDVHYIYDFERHLHFFIVYGLTEEEFNELEDFFLNIFLLDE